MLVLTFRGKEAASEHKNMLRAALKRDSDRAVKILRQHILNGIHSPLSLLNKKPSAH